MFRAYELKDQTYKRTRTLHFSEKLLQKNSLQRKCFGAINFVIITKESLYKANPLACFLHKKGHASGSNITKKIFWWNYFCNNYKDYYKRTCSKEFHFVIISATMVQLQHK